MPRTLLLVLFFFVSTSTPLYADSAPQYSFTDINGKTYSSTDLQGTPVVINIGSHWWQKCKDEAPELQRAYVAYQDKGVLFLGVFAMSKDKEIKNFAVEYGLSYPVGKENGIAEKLGVKGIPETVFINRNGVIVKRHYDVITYDALESEIKNMLK